MIAPAPHPRDHGTEPPRARVRAPDGTGADARAWRVCAHHEAVGTPAWGTPRGRLRRYRERRKEERCDSRAGPGRVPASGTTDGRLATDREAGDPGGEEYNDGLFRPPRSSVSYTPGHMIRSGYPRFLTRTCVWRNLSKASTVVQQGDHREGPT
ncbi:hypothetical protein GCM10010335_60940 [Streptomyces galbus]|nr:hypothetical protein GCM10010335_60940 [Streptomyces galbus]